MKVATRNRLELKVRKASIIQSPFPPVHSLSVRSQTTQVPAMYILHKWTTRWVFRRPDATSTFLGTTKVKINFSFSMKPFTERRAAHVTHTHHMECLLADNAAFCGAHITSTSASPRTHFGWAEICLKDQAVIEYQLNLIGNLSAICESKAAPMSPKY